MILVYEVRKYYHPEEHNVGPLYLTIEDAATAMFVIFHSWWTAALRHIQARGNDPENERLFDPDLSSLNDLVKDADKFLDEIKEYAERDGENFSQVWLGLSCRAHKLHAEPEVVAEEFDPPLRRHRSARNASSRP